MRLHLFEFEDFSWFPDVIRTGGTDYLRYFLIRTELYRPTITLLDKAVKESGHNRIIDLCSGGGGYIERVYEELKQMGSKDITIQLTDKFPNVVTYELIKKKTHGGIDYCTDSVDVFHVPKHLKGFRVLYSAVHHFKPEQVKRILEDAVEAKMPIAFFDGGEKSIFAILGLVVLHPIAFLLFTPFFKPFKLSRLLFTYIIPLIPIYTIWDGVVSLLRMYEPDDFKKIISSLPENNYNWQIGKTKNRFGIKASYLIAYPGK